MGVEAFSRDTLFSGKLVIYQSRDGYRFSIEALLLAGFVRLKKEALVAELGAGCGVISAILALRFPAARIVALEIQEKLSRALFLTVSSNGLDKSILPVRGDVKRWPLKAGRFSAVVMNPPFKPPKTGRLPPDEENLVARTESLADLSDFLEAAWELLKPGGRLFLVHSALRCAEVLSEMRNHGLEPKRLRFVHSYPGDEARFVLVEGRKGAGPEVRVLPPLFIYRKPKGPYSSEVARFFSAPEEGLAATFERPPSAPDLQ